MLKKLINFCAFCAFCGFFLSITAQAQAFPRPRPNAGPKPKNVHGIVRDLRGAPLVGAHVFIKDMKTKVSRVIETDQSGEYKIYGLTSAVDYEIYVDFKGKASEKKFVSSFLDREDNILNFQVDAAVIESNSAPAGSSDQGPSFKSFDLVELHASLDMPPGVPAPVPAVLLLHGYGEDRSVWKDFSKQLLRANWAVMTVDLRGHGDSRMKNKVPIQASLDWRTNPHEFPQDLNPALDWLKSRPRIDGQKIVVIGSDVGANLALIASGRFPEVRTAVAIAPNLNESLALAGSPQDFQPRSTLIVVADASAGDRIKAAVKEPSRVVAVRTTGTPYKGTGQWMADKQVTDSIFQWLKETF